MLSKATLAGMEGRVSNRGGGGGGGATPGIRRRVFRVLVPVACRCMGRSVRRRVEQPDSGVTRDGAPASPVVPASGVVQASSYRARMAPRSRLTSRATSSPSTSRACLPRRTSRRAATRGSDMANRTSISFLAARMTSTG